MHDLFHKVFSAIMLMVAVAAGAYFYGLSNPSGSIVGAKANEEQGVESGPPQFVLTARLAQIEGEKTLRDVSSIHSSNSDSPSMEEDLEDGGVFFSNSTFVRTSWSAPPHISAQAALVADLSQNGHSYFKVAEGKRWPLASITKLVTAVIAKKKVHSDEIIRLVKDDFVLGGNSHTTHLEAGSAYTAKDIIELMLVSSSNAGAQALMRTVGEEEFLAAMNAQAANWGLQSTHFGDPAGVYASNQSTAEEIAIMARKIHTHYLDLIKTTNQKSITIVDAVTGEQKVFQSTNQFAESPRFVGGKTGQTPEAKENLLSIFSHQGEPALIVVLGSQSRFKDTQVLYNWFTHDFIPSN